MKSDPMISVLVGVLAVSALASLGLCYLYVQDSRELRALQGQASVITAVNAHQMALRALLTDAVEYSRNHPDIDPLLQSLGIKQAKGAPASTNKPASK